ncbi:hypothetical protein MKZ38_001610 [Zalerion maritima]|uniref:Uncharacterized protein n=1 Tax=Zalerion maritima TaxID=339359 RepID=A0AAD5RQ23_9PEZI|nr:hypothetical protein MKZ38_001610 [Zalerion maritima]
MTATGALALTLPLGEAVGRVGCIFAGVRNTNSSTEEQRQFISSCLNIITYTVTPSLSLWKTQYLPLQPSANLALACQASARILAESQSKDIPRFRFPIFGFDTTPTTLLAYIQLIASMGWILQCLVPAVLIVGAGAEATRVNDAAAERQNQHMANDGKKLASACSPFEHV